MKTSGQLTTERRVRNAKAITAFGVHASPSMTHAPLKTVRKGNTVTIFTIGYEKRTGEELVSELREAGVDVLVDVREKAMSRKPDFRAAALQSRCENAEIDYERFPDLGSTPEQRRRLKETGNIEAFRRTFRAYARKRMDEPVNRLSRLAKNHSVALLCYERNHEDCHRSIIADFVADRLDASIVAFL